MMRGARRGCLRLRGAQIGIDNDDDSTFTISSDQKTFHFQARDTSEREKWIKALEETINCHSQSDKFHAFSVPSEEELNHRMAEAEAYFRILTQQVKTIENQINGGKSEQSTILKDSMTKMIESIGQSLELLNVAKTTMLKKMPVPVITGGSQLVRSVDSEKIIEENGITSKSIGDEEQKNNQNEVLEKGQDCLEQSKENEVFEIEHDFEDITTKVHADGNLESVAVPIVALQSSNENSKEYSEVLLDENHMDGNSLITTLRAVETMPCTSYSSSDDDDDDDDDEAEFFDANEYTGDGEFHSEQPKSHQDEKSRVRTMSFCDEDDDDASGDKDSSVEQHGSVITHLLSQVKIGMDLTKVTLPTFILERRSLLEMYADFFAHPDLFKGIPDFKDPKSRILQVLKWYLSSFHAGRKGSVAKKPYNPILGEIFQCKYDLTDEKTDFQNDVVADGPVEFAMKDDVSFLAEQVSHHPPISAFYAECYSKRVCFNSSIWTKSKFLGLSIGVNMVGEGKVYVLDHNEEYTMTFPSGYGRSILTVPWVELGGKTEINCQKTGYRVDIEFHTKPFYGGKRHRLTADVYAPGEKKPFMSVNGEWNGIMYATYGNCAEPEVFVDTFSMPTVKKQVQSLGKQRPFESRRMWQEVTKNLKLGNIEKATEAKHALEEKQRADARERKETNAKWLNRDFDALGNNVFVYKNPLWKRLATS